MRQTDAHVESADLVCGTAPASPYGTVSRELHFHRFFKEEPMKTNTFTYAAS